MQSVNLKELKRVLPTYFDLKIPLLLWGKPSTAKSSMIRQFAKEMAKQKNLKYSEDDFGKDIFTCKVIHLSQFDSSDLRGLPIKIDKNGYTATTFIPGEELPREGQGIIFLDEISMADEITRKACYQYILEGRYTNLPTVLDKNGLPSFWRVAASNEETDFSNINELGLALLRRFNHLQVVPEAEEILNYFYKIGVHPLVIAYLENFRSNFFPQKWTRKLVEIKANPFPCTWEQVSDILKTFSNSEMAGGHTINILVSGAVGPEIGREFVSFVKLSKVVKLAEVLANPEEAFAKIGKHDQRISIKYAILAEIGQLWIRGKKDPDVIKVDRILKCLDPVFQTFFLKLLVRRTPAKLLGNSSIRQLFQKLGCYLSDEDDDAKGQNNKS